MGEKLKIASLRAFQMYQAIKTILSKKFEAASFFRRSTISEDYPSYIELDMTTKPNSSSPMTIRKHMFNRFIKLETYRAYRWVSTAPSEKIFFCCQAIATSPPPEMSNLIRNIHPYDKPQILARDKRGRGFISLDLRKLEPIW